MRRLVGVCAVLAAVLWGAGCKDPGGTGKLACRVDGDCASALQKGVAEDWRCEDTTGVCYCRTDTACPANQFCNTSGFCQDRSGCARNSDCLGSGLFCDTTTGSCLTEGRCTQDLHCRVGQVCDPRARLCVDGCRTSGDCNSASCRCDGGPCNCTATTEAELAACAIGTCDPTFCDSPDRCRFGEKCEVLPDAGTDLAQCFSDYDPQRRPYCKPCTFGAGQEQCGRATNFCLIDQDNAGSYYCGVDCSSGETCPNGYSCANVVQFLSDRTCGADKACPLSTTACTGDAQCPRGTACSAQDGGSGSCQGACVGTEAGGLGVCGCVTDADCFTNTCSGGTCTATGQACTVDEDCSPVHCVEHGSVRGCMVGRNCAPEEGLTCLQVR